MSLGTTGSASCATDPALSQEQSIGNHRHHNLLSPAAPRALGKTYCCADPGVCDRSSHRTEATGVSPSTPTRCDRRSDATLPLSPTIDDLLASFQAEMGFETISSSAVTTPVLTVQEWEAKNTVRLLNDCQEIALVLDRELEETALLHVDVRTLLHRSLANARQLLALVAPSTAIPQDPSC